MSYWISAYIKAIYCLLSFVNFADVKSKRIYEIAISDSNAKWRKCVLKRNAWINYEKLCTVCILIRNCLNLRSHGNTDRNYWKFMKAIFFFLWNTRVFFLVKWDIFFTFSLHEFVSFCVFILSKHNKKMWYLTDV